MAAAVVETYFFVRDGSEKLIASQLEIYAHKDLDDHDLPRRTERIFRPKNNYITQFMALRDF